LDNRFQDDLPDLAFIRLNLAKPSIDVCTVCDGPSGKPFTNQHQGIVDAARGDPRPQKAATGRDARTPARIQSRPSRAVHTR